MKNNQVFVVWTSQTIMAIYENKADAMFCFLDLKHNHSIDDVRITSELVFIDKNANT